MASPFKIFRKYTGVLMVFLTVLLMVAFGLQDILGRSVGGGGGGRGNASRDANEVAVSWKGGELTNGELRQLVGNRQLLRALHDSIARAGYEAAVRDGTADLQLRVQPLAFSNQTQEIDAVDTKVFADAARDAGMAISNDAVKDFLLKLGRDKVNISQIRTIVAQIKRGYRTRVTIDQLFSYVRDALLARNYSQSYAYAVETVLPQQRFRDWLKVNDRVVVEAAGLPVESFLAQVPEPTEAELEEFFNEYKDRQPLPDVSFGVELPSATPGFRTPRRVSLQYVRADYEQALDAEMDKVSDEDVATYYEENKSQFIKADDLLSDDLSIGEDLFGSDDDDDDGEGEGEGEGEGDDEPTEESEDSAEPDETDSSDAASATDGDADGATKSDATAADEDQQSSAVTPQSPFRFVALQAKEEATDSEADEEANEETGGEQSESEEEVEYQPLEEVSDTIRRSLAEQRANESLNNLMDKLRDEMLEKYNEYFTEVVVETPEDEEPAPPSAEVTDLKSLADEYGFEFKTIDEATFFDLRDTDIGQSIDPTQSNPNANVTVLLFAADAGQIESYEPVSTISVSTYDRFLFQQTANLQHNTPTLDEVRDEVVAAWKKKKAAKIALAEVEKFAEQAESDGGDLEAFFANQAGVEVVETAPFSQMNIGIINPQTRRVPLRLSQPEEITAAGPKFMEAVFGLDEGEVAGVLNHDESIAYVVTIVRHGESVEQLRQGFAQEGGFWPGQPTMDRGRQRELITSFRKDLFGELDLDWKRPPDVER